MCSQSVWTNLGDRWVALRMPLGSQSCDRVTQVLAAAKGAAGPGDAGCLLRCRHLASGVGLCTERLDKRRHALTVHTETAAHGRSQMMVQEQFMVRFRQGFMHA